MKEGQQIIFRHPHSKEILCGVVGGLTVAYAFGKNKGFMPISHITEWCDAEAAFNALALQEVRRGNFEWAQPEGDAGDITRLCANLQHGGDNSNQQPPGMVERSTRRKGSVQKPKPGGVCKKK